MAPWRNGSVSVLHTEGGGSIPPGATEIMIMENRYFYLGEVPNEAVSFLEHIVNNTNLNVLNIMDKMNLGDPNRIYIAKILTRDNKKIKLKWN